MCRIRVRPPTPPATDVSNRDLWNFHPARGLQECANQGRRGGGRSFFSPCRFASAVRCDLPRTIAFTLYEKSHLGALICLDLSSFLNRVWVPDVAGKGSAGGLAVALREAFRAYQGLWFGWSGKVASQPASQPRMVDKGRVQYALMDLTSLDRQEYYNGFANRALWPTMHYRIGLSEFSRADYAGYLRVNRTFASALAKLVCPSDLVWVHDYHLIPLAAELRALGLTNPIGYFHHIPWPAPEVLGTLPGSTDLLRSIMDFILLACVQTEPGVLILSKFAGAAQQLTGALIVNPNDKLEVAEAIRDALQMSHEERVTRWLAPLQEHDVSWWAAAFLRELAGRRARAPVKGT